MDTARFLSIEDRWLPGIRQTLTPPGGVAGPNFSLPVPGGEMWRVITAHYQFLASAAVANRFVGFGAFQGSQTIFDTPFSGAIAANGSIFITAAVGYSYYNDIAGAALVTLPLPRVWLTPGMSFAFDTDGIQAGDQANGITVIIERVYLTNEEQSEFTQERYEYMLAEAAARGGQ